MHDPLLPGRPLRALAAIGTLAMVLMLVYGAVGGYAIAQMTAVASIAWGQVLLVDIYVGLALFAAWMLWRDGPRPATLAWIVALLVLGHLVACIYLFRALRQGETDGHRFWHGRRSPAAATDPPGPWR